MLENILHDLNIEQEKYLIIGCSGGPDSMALLHYLKHNTNNNIVCAHINHNVRKENQKEEEYLKNYRRDWFMFSDDIIKYGVADKIITDISEVF